MYTLQDQRLHELQIPFRNDSTDSPDCFTDTSEHIRFYFLVILFFHFLVFGSVL